jgi:hypothetical protein
MRMHTCNALRITLLVSGRVDQSSSPSSQCARVSRLLGGNVALALDFAGGAGDPLCVPPVGVHAVFVCLSRAAAWTRPRVPNQNSLHATTWEGGMNQIDTRREEEKAVGGWRERKSQLEGGSTPEKGVSRSRSAAEAEMPSESRLRCLQDSNVDPTDSEGATHNISRGWQTCVSEFLPSVSVWHCLAAPAARVSWWALGDAPRA